MLKIDFRRTYILIPLGYIAIILIGIAPFLIAGVADMIGECLNCNINEAGTDECIRWGIPFGKVLNPMFILGWLFLLSLPIAGLLLIGWTVFAAFKVFTDVKKRRIQHNKV